jgi:hypothetical protein
MKILCSIFLTIFAQYALQAQSDPGGKITPDSDQEEKEPLAYLRIFIPIEGDKNAKVQFGEVKPLPYPLEIKLKAGESKEFPILSGAYSFYFSGYTPVSPGNYELILSWGENLNSKQTLRFAKNDFYTFILRDKNGRPDLEILEDATWELNAEGEREMTKNPRLRICDLIGSNSTVVSKSLNLNSKIPKEIQSITIPSSGLHQLTISGTLNQKPFTSNLEADLSEFPQQTLFVVKDLYDRPVAQILPDAVDPQ